jgi:hypothetical protein
LVSATIRAACDGTALLDLDTGMDRTLPQPSIAGSDDHQVGPAARCSSSAVVTDAAGNTSSTGKKTFTVWAISDSPSRYLTYSKGWKRLVRSTAFGGTVRTTSTRGRWAQLRFTGAEIAVLAGRGPGRGRIGISIDGGRSTTVDLRAGHTLDRWIVFRRRLSPGRHTIVVRVLGTARHPRQGARVDIDGFLVIGP